MRTLFDSSLMAEADHAASPVPATETATAVATIAMRKVRISATSTR
jgi:hypothetical protein